MLAEEDGLCDGEYGTACAKKEKHCVGNVNAIVLFARRGGGGGGSQDHDDRHNRPHADRYLHNGFLPFRVSPVTAHGAAQSIMGAFSRNTHVAEQVAGGWSLVIGDKTEQRA